MIKINLWIPFFAIKKIKEHLLGYKQVWINQNRPFYVLAIGAVS